MCEEGHCKKPVKMAFFALLLLNVSNCKEVMSQGVSELRMPEIHDENDARFLFF